MFIHLPNWPRVCNQFEELKGKSYIPSNGTEGMIFEGAFCNKCRNLHPNPEKQPQCEIILEAYCGENPIEWQRSSEGWPVCTSWKFWDWGNDRDGYNEPPEPEPDDPSQLLIPFDITDYFQFGEGVVVTKNAILEL